MDKLGCLPLAIEQAGAYINRISKPLSSYLPLFESNVKALMDKKPSAATWQYRDDTVFTTWEISFAAVQRENPKAAELLLVCSFFSDNEIVDELLVRGLGSTG